MEVCTFTARFGSYTSVFFTENAHNNLSTRFDTISGMYHRHYGKWVITQLRALVLFFVKQKSIDLCEKFKTFGAGNQL